MTRVQALRLAIESMITEAFEIAGPHGRGESEATQQLAVAQRLLWEMVEELEESERAADDTTS